MLTLFHDSSSLVPKIHGPKHFHVEVNVKYIFWPFLGFQKLYCLHKVFCHDLWLLLKGKSVEKSIWGNIALLEQKSTVSKIIRYIATLPLRKFMFCLY